MIEKMAWETFKNTGNINTMMELLKMDKTKVLETNFNSIAKKAEAQNAKVEENNISK